MAIVGFFADAAAGVSVLGDSGVVAAGVAAAGAAASLVGAAVGAGVSLDSESALLFAVGSVLGSLISAPENPQSMVV